jgi:hypothetical protein
LFEVPFIFMAKSFGIGVGGGLLTALFLAATGGRPGQLIFGAIFWPVFCLGVSVHDAIGIRRRELAYRNLLGENKEHD